MKKLLILISLFLFIYLPLIAQEDVKKSEDYYQWLRQYENAKSRLETGNTVMALGTLTSFANFVLYFTKKEEVINYDIWGFPYTEEKHREIFLIGGITGSVISVAGFLMAGPAKSEVRILELEGARKGYLMMRPIVTRDGFGIQLSFKF